MFDVFLCYTWADDKTTWADALYVELRRLGVSVFKDDVDIPFGDTLAPHLQDALLGSRVLVPLIGPRFHESATCRLELLTALTHAYRLGDGTTERVMPVTWRVRPSALRPAQLRSARLVSREQHDVESQAALIAAKVARIKTADDRRFGDVPALPKPAWYPVSLPANKRFHGRSETLWDLHDAFRVKDKPGNLGHPVVSVTGVGGQGKSLLCEQYARSFAQDHPGGVFLIRLGGSDQRVHRDPRVLLSQYHLGLRAIGERLELTGADTGSIAAIAGELAGRAPYLWIVDDVPPAVDERQLEQLVAPTGNGRTLFSTRGRLAKWVSVELTLAPLGRAEGVRVLTGERPLPGDDPLAKAAAAGIVDDLNAHPLGLTIAAGLTSLPSFPGYPALRQELRRTTRDSLELAAHLAEELPVGYAKPFSATLTRSFEQLTDAGRDLLAVTSVLGPAPIPLDLAGGVLTRLGRAGVEQGLHTMSAHGLADDLGNDSYLTHALVARAARFRFATAHLNRLREKTCDLIGDSLEGNRGRFDLVRSSEPYLPHVLPLVANSEWPSSRTQWHMLGEAGRTRYELGDTAGALESLEFLNDRCANSAEVDEQTRMGILVNLGAAHFGQGNLTEALRIQRETVRRFTELSGPDHRDTLQAEENLANTLSALGDHGTARRVLTEVYRARRAKDGLTDRYTLIALNNLVIAVGRCGDSGLALRLALGAAALWYRAVGPDAPETLECVENAANNLLRLGSRDEAAETYGYLAERRRAVLGPDHPSTIDAEENLATARRSSYWPSYANRLRVQGPLHPDTLNTLERLLRPSTGGGALERVDREPVRHPVENVRLDGEHAEKLAEIVTLAVRFEDQEAVHGPDDPRALRAKIVLTHALAAADQYDGQIEVALLIAEDSRDGLEEAAARTPGAVDPDDLRIAEAIHHWILALQGEEASY